MQEMNMRRSLAILLATAAAAAASAATLSVTQAAPLPAPAVTTGIGAVEPVRDRHWDGGDWNNGDWNYGHRRHHGHHGHHRDNYGVFPGFSFGFGYPQAYYRPHYYQPYYGYGDCFRTWDGQLICR